MSALPQPSDFPVATVREADRRVSAVAECIQSAAATTDHLCQDGGLTGDLPARLIETSHALHLAVVTLEDVDGSSRANQQVTHPVIVGHVDNCAYRRRVADDLNAVVVNRIFEAGLILDGARRLIDNQAAVEMIDLTTNLLDSTLRSLRHVVAGVNHPDS